MCFIPKVSKVTRRDLVESNRASRAGTLPKKGHTFPTFTCQLISDNLRPFAKWSTLSFHAFLIVTSPLPTPSWPQPPTSKHFFFIIIILKNIKKCCLETDFLWTSNQKDMSKGYIVTRPNFWCHEWAGRQLDLIYTPDVFIKHTLNSSVALN